MAFSQKGVRYDGRNELDPKVRRSIDDVLSQVQAGLKQVQATPQGKTPPPSAPDQVAVGSSGGFATVTITHNNPPKGTAYIIEYSTTTNFTDPVRIDNGISETWQQYLSGQTLYFKAASTLYTSEMSPWTYYGSSTNPTPTTF